MKVIQRRVRLPRPAGDWQYVAPPQLRREQLGRLESGQDPRTLRLAAYEAAQLPPAPVERDWSARAQQAWGAHGNVRLQCCTAAAAADLVHAWTATCGGERVPEDDDVLAMYRAVSGYDPADPATDRGASMLDALRYWRATGLGGDRIEAFARVDHTDLDAVRRAAAAFGGLYVGAQLPLTTRGYERWLRADAAAVETPDARPGSRGGHAMALVAFDGAGVTFATWGRLQGASWRWWKRYVDEVYAVVSPLWAPGGLRSPSGFDMRALRDDLATLAAT